MLVNSFCGNCGTKIENEQAFCPNCGQPVASSSTDTSVPEKPPVSNFPPQTYPPATMSTAPPPNYPPPNYPPATQMMYPQPPKAKKKSGVIIAISVAVLVVAILAVVLIASLLKDKDKPAVTTQAPQTTNQGASLTDVELIPFPAELIISQTSQISANYKTPSIIIPANYRSLDYVVYLQCWTDQGNSEAMVTVEIPGFTQKYEQKISVSRLETEISIRPPLLAGAIDNLNSSKDAQIVVSVTDLERNKIVLQESRSVTLYSRYDMQWVDAQGTPYYENILAWVTPEADEIRTLLRLSADSVNELTEGELNAIVGYQYIYDWNQDQITYAQVASMMHALSAKLGVKYLMTPFSSTSTELQRIATPAQVINTAGGLCAETAVTIASAIQATDMHAVLIMLPGHMQVAVETWTGSGEYFLIETTALEAAAEGYFDSVIEYLTPEEWTEYMSEEGMYAIDCDLASELGIHAID